jgi:hypothetical protein
LPAESPVSLHRSSSLPSSNPESSDPTPILCARTGHFPNCPNRARGHLTSSALISSEISGNTIRSGSPFSLGSFAVCASHSILAACSSPCRHPASRASRTTSASAPIPAAISIVRAISRKSGQCETTAISAFSVTGTHGFSHTLADVISSVISSTPIGSAARTLAVWLGLHSGTAPFNCALHSSIEHPFTANRDASSISVSRI